MNLLDTIAAISTPFGKGGIAVIRISGTCAIDVADKVFSAKSGRRLSESDSSRALYGAIMGEKDGKRFQMDDGIAVIFRAPHSFTGEDTVEISCHGGVLVTQRVLEAVLLSGARLAMAGEFTRRAFINGRMTLTAAEALGDLLSAGTDDQIKLARSGMSGRLSEGISEIYDSLCKILAAIYAHIDYPDEDLADISREEMLDVVQDCLSRLESLCKTYTTGHAVGEGVATSIVGRTNAGKSSLYNLILGRDAAIVTDIAGTTRDVLTENATLGRVSLRLSDTAGLRNASDTVERIGIDRARRAAEEAELILAVFDGSREPDDEDTALANYVLSLDGVTIAVINKSDLGILDSVRDMLSRFEHVIPLSASSGAGYGELVSAVEQIYIDEQLDIGSDAIISNARQHVSARSASDILSGAVRSIEVNAPLEICCVEIEEALAALGELDGRTVSEDIVSRIFADFCVGK